MVEMSGMQLMSQIAMTADILILCIEVRNAEAEECEEEMAEGMLQNRTVLSSIFGRLLRPAWEGKKTLTPLSWKQR